MNRSRRAARGTGLAVSAVLAASALTAAVAPTAAVASDPAPKEPVNSCFSTDNTDPFVNTLSMTPKTLDVRHKAKTLKIVAKASDDGGPGPKSGVAQLYIDLQSRNNDGASYNLQLKKHGPFTWTASQLFRRWSSPGPWDVESITVVDHAGNSRIFEAPVFPIGLQTTFNVKSGKDDKAPLLGNIDISKKRLRAGNKPVALPISVHASDDKSGVAEVDISVGRINDGEGYVTLEPVKGHPSLLRGVLQLPPDLGVAKWHVQSVNVFDRAGNNTFYDRDQAAMHGDHLFTLIAGRDSQGPTLVGLKLSGRAFDARKKAKHLAIQMHTKDAKSGSAFAFVELVDSGGNEVASSFMTPQVSGPHPNVHDVRWKGSIAFLPCHSTPGTFHVRVQLYDAVGNRTQLTRGTVKVLAHDHATPTASIGFGQDMDGPYAVHFDKPVDGISLDSLTVWTTTQPSVQVPMIDVSCKDAASVPVPCLTGAVSEADLAPNAPLSPADYYIIVNPEGTLQATDLQGDPFRQSQVLFSVS